MNPKVDTVDTDRGNTKKPDLRSRGWFFTLNNPGEETHLIEIFEISGCEKFVFQLEVGELGTPHFQGMVYYTNARSFSSMKELNNEIHWEKMKDLRKSIAYCTKIETRIAGPWAKGIKIPKQIKLIDPSTRIWQKDLVAELEVDPDDRTIIWYYDPVGGSGKTALAKWLVIKKRALVVSGKASDIKFAVMKHIEKFGEVSIVCFLFPRTVEEYVSYDAIESLKDGLFFSGKYESGMCAFASPHIICFANFEPDKEKLSLDRWDIRSLSEKKEVSVEQFLMEY